MRLNWNTALVGDVVTLRPYRRCHVPAYHAWMSDAALREATASDELSLEEELANQRSWVDDERKLTFIVHLSGARHASSVALPSDVTEGMVGDANLFFLQADHCGAYVEAAGAAADATCAEIMVMIASPAARRRGCAAAAVAALLRYAMERCGVGVFVAKIGESNAASLALFSGRLGFTEGKRLPCFGEVHLVCGPAQDLRERVYALTAAAGYAEVLDPPHADEDFAAPPAPAPLTAPPALAAQ